MESKITSIDWLSSFKDKLNVVSIGNDIMLFDNVKIAPVFKHPVKANVTTGVICIKGFARGTINMTPFSIQAPCFVTVLADQILQYDEVSDDFDGLFIVMSKYFADSLFTNVKERLPLFLATKNQPVTPLTDELLETLKTCYGMLHKIAGQDNNPNRLDIVRHLTLAFFYHTGSQMHKTLDDNKKSRQELLLETFLDIVQKHFKENRSVEFYADKLCFTSKYLSTVIRQTSGKTAGEWIDEYVILEAKALLKSTNMTIQQISDELNFSSQSFFGKYFKRMVGISPKEYRRN